MLDLKREYEYMKADIDTAIKRCLEHQKWILGPEVKELEEKIAAYLSVKNCIGVSSGTDALVLSLRALAIKKGGQEYFDKSDKIITTPFTFTATGDAILRSGATPVFVDIDPRTYNLDANKILECLNSIKNIVGIVPVHLYGQPCAMDTFMDIAGKHKLFVVEDVAQAFGATWKGKKLGSIGALGAFSFFPSKNLGGFGDGGMVATNDPELADLVRMLLKHGGKDKYNVDHIGYNARLDTLQAAVLLAKLKYLDEFNEKRRAIAGIYDRKLANFSGIQTPQNVHEITDPHSCHVYHQYTIRVQEGNRTGLQNHLKGQGIDTMIYYPTPLHKMKIFGTRSTISGNIKETEQASTEVLSLPIDPLFSTAEITYIVQKMREYVF